MQVSDSVLLIFAAALLLDTTMLTIIFLFAALVHEMGHILAVLICKGRILSVKITVFGGVIHYHQDGGRLRDIIIAMSGPLIGIITAYISAKLGYFVFSGANLILSIVNLLPVLPLDGGRIIEQIVPHYIVKIIGYIVIIIVTILGILLVIYGKGCSLMLFSCVLWSQYGLRSIAKPVKIR